MNAPSRSARVAARLSMAMLLCVSAARSQDEAPSSFGLLFGVRAGVVVPGGAGTIRGPANIGSLDLSDGGKSDSFADYVKVGGGAGFDAFFRFARMFLVGGSFDVAALTVASQEASHPSIRSGSPSTVTGSATTTYVGAAVGIIPDVDHVSFIGDLGIGSRRVNRALSLADKDPQSADSHVSGLDFTLGAGVSVPAGSFRIVPKISASVGSFSSVQQNDKAPKAIPSADEGIHFLVFLGLAAYYSLDFAHAAPQPK